MSSYLGNVGYKGSFSYGAIGGTAGLNYTGKKTGRMLSYTKMNGWYFFKYGGLYERDPAKRGFDCMTYVGTANGLASTKMGGTSDAMAGTLGASKIDMENKSKEDVITFFNGDGKNGKYFAWTPGHCFVVLNGVVHDWSPNTNGYRKTNATGFGWDGANNCVRKL